MAVKIRLKRMGSKKKPFYRLIAADSRNARDGRFIETLGYYNPLPDPPHIKIEEDSLFKWLERGAVPSTNAESILKRLGIMQKWQLLKQGVKKEDLDAKLEQMGVKTVPVATGEVKKKKAAKAAPAEEATKAEAAPADAPTDEAAADTTAQEAPKDKAEAEAPAVEAASAEEESGKGE